MRCRGRAPSLVPVSWYPSAHQHRDGSSGLGSGARVKQSPSACTAPSTDAVQELKNALKGKKEISVRMAAGKFHPRVGRILLVTVSNVENPPVDLRNHLPCT